MKYILMLLISAFCFTSFTTKKTVDTYEVLHDTYEVLYDSKPINFKEGIKLSNGKSLQIINQTSGKLTRVEVTVNFGKRLCYEKSYMYEEAKKPIFVNPFIGGACSDADRIVLFINNEIFITIPIIK